MGLSSEEVVSEEEDSAGDEECADGDVGGRFVLFAGRWSDTGPGRGEVC